MKVRLEAAEDAAAVDAVVRDAFGDARVAALLDGLRRSPRWVPELSLVAEDDDGRVVGHVAFSRGWLDDPAALVDVLVLSPLSVRTDGQRRGAGSALVREALARASRRPEPVVFLEGAPGYYQRFGFLPAEGLGFDRPSPRIPAPAFQAVTLPSYRPDLRGALVYPEVFWAHDCVGLRG